MRTSEASGAVWAAAAVVALALAAAPAGASDPPVWKDAVPGYAWSFPRDHWAHPEYRNEWWYFTGHLESTSEPVRRFGFQFTIFRVGIDPRDRALDSDWDARNLWMGHASISDKDRALHRFSEVLYRDAPLLATFGVWPDPTIARSLGPPGTASPWTLRWNGEGFDLSMTDTAREMALELRTRPLRPLVFQGPGGLSRKSDVPGAASLYTTFPRLETSGTLAIDGETHEVRGITWMDAEISSNQLTSGQVGWDWFGLRLDDGRDLMLYELRRANGGLDYGKGTLVDREGSPRYLESADWTLRTTGRWVSPESGIAYPSGWTIVVPSANLELRVEPDLPDQENRSRAELSYWEGAVTLYDAAGRRAGEGYVELTGYGEDNRPPI